MQNRVLFGTAALAGIIFTGIATVAVMRKYIARYLFEPALIEKQSASGWSLASLLGLEKKVNLEDHMVIGDQLANELKYIMQMTKNIKKNGGHFENILLELVSLG